MCRYLGGCGGEGGGGYLSEVRIRKIYFERGTNCMSKEETIVGASDLGVGNG